MTKTSIKGIRNMLLIALAIWIALYLILSWSWLLIPATICLILATLLTLMLAFSRND